MKKQELMDEILRILHTIKEDEQKLQEILTFLQNEFYESDDDDEVELPEKYQGVVKTIAENIDAGLVCFLNFDTLEIEEFPQEMLDDPEEFEAMTGESFESLNFKHLEWKKYAKFEPLKSFESFEIMIDFTNTVDDVRLNEKLNNALNHERPFANFKAIIENSGYRQKWFDFKQIFIENQVKDQLSLELFENELKETNGFYDDDGNKINPEDVPVPSLCIICKQHYADDWEENLLCLMNRHDQKDDKDFECGAFEKI